MKRFWLAASGLAIASGILMHGFAERTIALQTSAGALAQSPSPSPAASPSPSPSPTASPTASPQVTPSPATSPVAPTATPARRPRPIANVNPNRPIQIRVVNAGQAPVIATLTQPASNDRRVNPGATVTFGSTSKSFLPPPVDLLIYPVDPNVAVNMYVSAANNVVEVVVGQQLSGGAPGNLSLSIDTDGGVYRF